MENDLTRQDEEISARGFELDEGRDPHDFGNWPEIAGAVLTALLIWTSFAFTG